MKQLLFLLLFPCLALAQYPANGNQKISLGEQTTADGLVYRGLAADTTRKPSVDTMAYILLDTNTNIIWQYKKATNNAWTRVGGSISSGVTGVLPLANGGTGSATKNFVDLTTTQTVAGDKTFSNKSIFSSGFESGNSLSGGLAFTLKNTTNNQQFQVGYSIGGSVYFFQIYDGSAFNDLLINALIKIKSSTYVGIGETNPAVQLHTTGGVRFAGLASITDLRTDADGDLYNGSDFNLKNSIDTINFGLSDVLKLKPVSFNWNDEARNINEYKSMGFIAQDVMDVIPNAASTMGDGDMQVDYNAIVATLTKAIQEQQALIKALEQRILILENK